MNNLKLKAPEPEDIDFLFDLENQESHWLVSNNAAPYSKFQIKLFVQEQQTLTQNAQCRWMIADDQRAYGCLDLFEYSPFHSHVQLGIIIDEKHRNQGIGKKTLELFDDRNRDFLHIKNVIAHVSSENPASLNLFQSNGYKEVGKLIDYKKASNESYSDLIIFQKQYQFG